MSTGTPAWATGADTAASCSRSASKCFSTCAKATAPPTAYGRQPTRNAKTTVLWHGSGTLRTQPDETDAVLVWVCCSSDTVKVEAAEAARVVIYGKQLF